MCIHRIDRLGGGPVALLHYTRCLNISILDSLVFEINFHPNNSKNLTSLIIIIIIFIYPRDTFSPLLLEKSILLEYTLFII